MAGAACAAAGCLRAGRHGPCRSTAGRRRQPSSVCGRAVGCPAAAAACRLGPAPPRPSPTPTRSISISRWGSGSSTAGTRHCTPQQALTCPAAAAAWRWASAAAWTRPWRRCCCSGRGTRWWACSCATGTRGRRRATRTARVGAPPRIAVACGGSDGGHQGRPPARQARQAWECYSCLASLPPPSTPSLTAVPPGPPACRPPSHLLPARSGAGPARRGRRVPPAGHPAARGRLCERILEPGACV